MILYFSYIINDGPHYYKLDINQSEKREHIMSNKYPVAYAVGQKNKIIKKISRLYRISVSKRNRY